MSFRPNPNDELTINGVTYCIAEHPSAPGMPHGQEGRAGIVYHLLSYSGKKTVGESLALKVFKPRFRLPYLVNQSEKLASFADLPGLQAARRRVLTPTRHVDLLRKEPDLTYAVLMPWIEGPTWLEVVLDKKPFSPEQSLALARALAEALVHMEERGLAHCDLSGPNVILPVLVGGTGIALIDLEGFYATGMLQPQSLSSGSAGYAHQQASGGLWGPESDRFAGAILLAEMLSWCDPQVTQITWGESYFEPGETQHKCERYQALFTSLHRHWDNGVAGLLERAWQSDSLSDCPTFGEWLVALPVSSKQIAGIKKKVDSSTPRRKKKASNDESSERQLVENSASEKVETLREVRAFMQAAKKMEERGNLDGAIETFHQAQELAASDPDLDSLAREIALTLRDLEVRFRGIQSSVTVSPILPASSDVSIPKPPVPAKGRPYRKNKDLAWIPILFISLPLIVWIILTFLRIFSVPR